ncbi:helix-turn-helix domain-containing protein [Spirillospora sp. CA-108201]
MSDRGPWTDPKLRAAWAAGDWRTIFRRYRAVTGLSQREVEALTGLTQPQLSNYENGVKKPTYAKVIERITRGLGVPDELSGTSAYQPEDSGWQPPAELRERIAHAHSRGHADMRVAEWISQVLASHRRAEDVVGGRELWPVVRSQLEQVTRLLPDASGRATDQLLILAAEHAHWLSWVAAREDQPGPALAWLDLAQGWAFEAGSDDLVSWVTRVRSHYALTNQDPVRALRTAEMARGSMRALSPAAASIAAHTAGMAAAAVGERDRARTLADEALTLAEQVPDSEDRPGWLYWLDPVRARLQYADIAYSAHAWSDAAAGYAASLDQLRDYPRDHAYYAKRYEDARRRTSSS